MNTYYVAKVICANHSGLSTLGFAVLPMFVSLEMLRMEYPEPIGFFVWNAPDPTIDDSEETEKTTKLQTV